MHFQGASCLAQAIITLLVLSAEIGHTDEGHRGLCTHHFKLCLLWVCYLILQKHSWEARLLHGTGRCQKTLIVLL